MNCKLLLRVNVKNDKPYFEKGSDSQKLMPVEILKIIDEMKLLKDLDNMNVFENKSKE